MGQETNGFFDHLVEGFAKDYEMKKIVEASRDHSGKIDVAKATGIPFVSIVSTKSGAFS